MLAKTKVKCQNLVATAIKKAPNQPRVPSEVKRLLSKNTSLNSLPFGTVITFEASMLGPKCNDGFITFRTNGL